MLKVYAVLLNEVLGEDDFETLINKIDNEKQARIRRFFKEEDKQRTLIADILTRWMISQIKNVSLESIAFSKNEYGKPYLLDSKGLFFNVSHSGKWVVCAVSDEEIGIDVEYMEKNNIGIAERFYHKSEYEQILAHTNAVEAKKTFYYIWSGKESYVKRIGKGLSIPLDAFKLKVENEHIELIEPFESHTARFTVLTVDPDYSMVVCSKEEAGKIEFIHLKLDEFISLLFNKN